MSFQELSERIETEYSNTAGAGATFFQAGGQGFRNRHIDQTHHATNR
jgi:hypothetical protein